MPVDSLLFRAGQIGTLELPNRIIKSATYECLADVRGVPQPGLIDYHRVIAEGGTGLGIVAYAAIDPGGLGYARQIRLYDDAALPRLRELTAAVHAAGGRVALQLFHAGRAADPALVDGVAWAPSPVTWRFTMLTPRELDEPRICKLIDAFAEGAARAKKAGFDAVQLQAAHGYLLSQFLSPFTNRRQDRWGGDPERRRRVLREVVGAMRDAVGSDYPMLVKLNVRDHIRGGLEPAEARETALDLQCWGVDCIELSGGFTDLPFHTSRGSIPVQPAQRGQSLARRLAIGALAAFMQGQVAFEREAYFLDDALVVAQDLDVPVALVGGMRHRQVMEHTLRSGQIDFISMARPLIREPDLPRRMAAGTTDASTCINCNACLGELTHENPIRCHQAYPDGGPPPYADWIRD